MYSFCGTNIVIFFHPAKRKAYFFTFLPLFYAPCTLDVLYAQRLNMVFCFIIEITEEINACEGLQFTDIGHIRTQLVVALIVFWVIGVLVLVFDPEGEGLVAALVFAEEGHEKVFWHDKTVGKRA